MDLWQDWAVMVMKMVKEWLVVIYQMVLLLHFRYLKDKNRILWVTNELVPVIIQSLVVGCFYEMYLQDDVGDEKDQLMVDLVLMTLVESFDYDDDGSLSFASQQKMEILEDVEVSKIRLNLMFLVCILQLMSVAEEYKKMKSYFSGFELFLLYLVFFDDFES